MHPIALFTICVAAVVTFLQPEEGKNEPAEGAAPQAASGVRRRLPAHFGRIVDDAQRRKVYAIQAKYDPRIDELEAEIKTLMEKRNAEYWRVLTPAQQKQYDNLAGKENALKTAAARVEAKSKTEPAPEKPVKGEKNGPKAKADESNN